MYESVLRLVSAHVSERILQKVPAFAESIIREMRVHLKGTTEGQTQNSECQEIGNSLR